MKIEEQASIEKKTVELSNLNKKREIIQVFLVGQFERIEIKLKRNHLKIAKHVNPPLDKETLDEFEHFTEELTQQMTKTNLI